MVVIRFGVLIVDENRRAGWELGRFFRNFGCQTFVAGSPPEAVDIFSKESIQLVLVNFQFPATPSTNGIGLTEALKVIAKNKKGWIRRIFGGLGVHFVLMDSSHVTEFKVRAEGIRFLKQPVEREELNTLLKELGILKIPRKEGR